MALPRSVLRASGDHRGSDRNPASAVHDGNPHLPPLLCTTGAPTSRSRARGGGAPGGRFHSSPASRPLLFVILSCWLSWGFSLIPATDVTGRHRPVGEGLPLSLCVPSTVPTDIPRSSGDPHASMARQVKCLLSLARDMGWQIIKMYLSAWRGHFVWPHAVLEMVDTQI